MNAQHAALMVVSQDQGWTTEIEATFRSEIDCRIDVILTGNEALRRLVTESPDVLIVDQSRIGSSLDGLELCRMVRLVSASVGLILVTNSRAVEDKIRAFELGIDECLLKGCDCRELLVRVRSLMRRLAGRDVPHPSRPDNATSPQSRLLHGPIAIDLITQRVFVDELPIELSRRQFLLLVYLIRNAGRVVSEREIREKVLGTAPAAEGSAVRNQIYGLRQRLGAVGRLVCSSLRGGYTMSPISQCRPVTAAAELAAPDSSTAH